ncbi:metallophosphoesterase 1-like isoform X3 [Hyposmocoma kahamanoa]|uniref:metallophosphoesterase 1-like isoform X3 n=1 Tax=Hyposmocoma kahamanoa TaxID=1477025 RepID=UPI000E6D9005|nr:metallophosphoesterase 1-like isoform X3 [Hyposmocoma kahamanoa]
MAFFLARVRRNLLTRAFPRFALGVVFIYIYCEYLIYYVTQLPCDWPALKEEPVEEPVYAMVLADTHLLGSRQGHWLDKWRREWQMHRAFQTAMTLHRPETVFVLGDLFDEGKWCSESEFNDYVDRFHKLFKVPEGTSMHVVVGNHDIGFHYSKKLTREVIAAGPVEGDKFRRITPKLARRFEIKLDAPPVKLVSIRANHFVLINSMAMEGDGCRLCTRAMKKIDRIADILKCSNGSPLCKGDVRLENYTRPIIMQHYPFYRESDSICTESDAAPLPERNNLFEERWDCLSKESTEYLVENLLPRAVFGAHTHHSCRVRHSFKPTTNHKIEFVEYTVPSFSWRNRLDPKYYLVTVSPAEIQVSKCGLPREWTMQVTAVLMLMVLLLFLRYYGTGNYFNYKLLVGKKM